MTMNCFSTRARVTRALLAIAAAAGLVPLTASVRATADDPPELDVQPCNRWLVNVPAAGHPFRESCLCEPIPLLDPDPCAVAWGVETLPNGSVHWTELGSTPQEPYSACWLLLNRAYDGCHIIDPENPVYRFGSVPGYPLSINLLANPSIGDFLPPSPTLGGSSVALLPPGAAGEPTGWRGLQRPVHEGAVDLITGLPFAQFTDLELPFGGSTFRLIRTRSQSMNLERYSCAGAKSVDDWWDWAGNGWMISESPLLLIDSAIPDIVGNGPRVTYLVLDAHHSIPFIRFDDSGRYEAPARFRATLRHDGVWANGDWVVAPKSYTASLYDGALTYTFVVVRQDVPNNIWDTTASGVSCSDPVGEPVEPLESNRCLSSLHARPFLPQQFSNEPDWDPINADTNPGQGVPHYGLCTRIEDRYGHAVEISFTGQTQYALDNPQSPGPDATTPCVECMQDCPGKGQIHSIRLTKRDGSGGRSVEWTLLYRYRIAPRWPEAMFTEPCSETGSLNWALQIPATWDHYGARVLDSIFVYRGDESLAGVPKSALSISTESVLYDGNDLPTADALDTDAPLDHIPSGWLHRVRYHYAFQLDEIANETAQCEGMLDQQPRLLKTTVISRTQTANGPAEPSTIRSRVFEYVRDLVGPMDAWLAAVYEPEAVARAIDYMRERGYSTFGVNDLAMALDPSGEVYATFDFDFEEIDATVHALASVRWTPGAYAGLDDVDSLRSPLPGALSGYIRTDQPLAEARFDRMSARDVQVETLVTTDEQGIARYYRFRRLVAGPEVETDSTIHPFPHRSAFHAPYAWRGYGDPSDSHMITPPEDYTKPRWITIIDEFATEKAMFMGGPLESSGFLLPDDQESREALLSRRVVHVGASGAILRDHRWQFRDGELVDAAGNGLGAEYVYWSVEDFIASEYPERLLPPPSSVDPPDPPSPLPAEVFGHLRNELLLIEHRSVGWSVAESRQMEADRGLVRFFDYELLTYDGDPANAGAHLGNGWYSDTVARVELKAEGVKEGHAYERNSSGTVVRSTTGGPRLYTREFFRPENPAVLGGLPEHWPAAPDSSGRWEHLCEVRYLVPTTAQDRLAAAPPPGSAPEMTQGPRPEPRYAASYALTQRREPDPADPLPAFSLPVQSTLNIGPARRQRPGGPWYFPVERQQFDVDGRLARTMTGLVRDPLVPGNNTADPLQSLAHTVCIYESEGRLRHTIADVYVGASGELPSESMLEDNEVWERPEEARVADHELQSVPAECWPDGWPRIEQADPRNYITTYVYNNQGNRLSDIYFPNGRRWASRIVLITSEEAPGDSQRRALLWNSDDFWQENEYGDLSPLPEEQWYVREYIFNEIEAIGGDLSSRVVGEIRDYSSREASGRPRIVRRAVFATGAEHTDIQDAVPLQGFLADPQPEHQPRFLEEQRIEYGVDSSGRLAVATLLETGPNGDIVDIGVSRFYDLVDVIREVAFDGTVTRTTRNLLGQPMRRYIGTDDSAWTEQGASTDGLALVERTEYGLDINNAWLPVVTRRYTHNPTWDTDPYGEPPSADTDGYATVTHYDWRMRPVRVDQFGETAAGNRDIAVAPRLSTTLTYLDHADRPIVVATFGGGTLSLPADLDPVQRREWDDDVRPDVDDLYGLTLKPTSVVETFYGPDGETVERRTYHYDPGTQQVTRHEEHTYAGRGGQTVYEQRPGQPVAVSVLDGLARTISTSRLGVWSSGCGEWGYELARTDFDVDADGNTVATAQFERVLPDGDSLTTGGAANAVRTRSAAWFDPQKRLIASAELGTESRGPLGAGESLMIACPTVYSRVPNDANASSPFIQTSPVQVNRAGLPDWALLSVNRYSLLTGRLIWSSAPDGSITEMAYDKAGRLARRTENAFGPAGSISRTTEYEYTLGRLTGIVVSRTPGDPEPGDRQVTRVVYGARLLEQTPGPVGGSTPPMYQDSGVHHASLVGRMHLPVAATGEPPAAASNPPTLPQSDPNLDTGEIVLRYTFDGQIAERTDARGVTFRYFYDALGRLAWVVVGSYDGGQFYTKLPSSMLDGPVPVDRIMAIQYLYNDEGRLSDVIARTNADDPNSVLTHTRYEYDARGNLIREWQGHDGHLGVTPPASTARVDYEWEYAPTDTPAGALGHDRLAAIIYPRPPNGAESDRRRVNLVYGAGASIDDTISRLTELTSGYNSTFSSVAQFQYAGVSRRVAMTLGAGPSAIVADLRAPGGPSDPVGLTGLDMFGRLRDLHFRNTASPDPQTLFRAEHAYDDSGNRLFDRITQWPSPALGSGGSYTLDARSQIHGYDDLHRLTASTVARVDLTTTPGQILPASGSVLREDLWWLDVLGNWQPGLSPPSPTDNSGRYATGDLDGYGALAGGTSLSGLYASWQDPGAVGGPDLDPDHLFIAPVVNARNEVEDVLFRTKADSPWYTQDVAILHDAAGNLVFDGTYIYHYDAWGRLVAVNAGAVNPDEPRVPGRPYACLVSGPTLKHYTYDGLGRLIRTQSPFPTPQHAALGEVRSERFYYDGIRRIQETRLDPSKNLGGAMLAGDPQIESAAQASLQEAQAGTGDPVAAEIDLTAAPLTLENQLLAMADPGPGPGPGPDQPASPVQLVREYVWGPGDAWHPASVDELLCYYGEGREAYWPIQDSSGDVAAVCVPGTQANGYAARVAAQQRYDAYGQVISADHLLPHAFLAAGHKGLFYDRLDRGVSDGSARGSTIPPSSATTDTPRLVPFARGLYHVRNRTLLPGGGGHTAIALESLTCANPPTCSTWTLSQQGLSSGAAVHGRFMQADPNATGMVLVRVVAFHGIKPAVTTDSFRLESRFADGENLYAYLAGSPWRQSDPMGLYMWGGPTDTLFTGGAAFALTHLLLEGHRFITGEAAEWASDWDRDDAEIEDLAMMATTLAGQIDDEVDEIAGAYAPFIASAGASTRYLKLGKLTIRAMKLGGKAGKAFLAWLNSGPKNVTLYITKKNGRPYVGITNNMVRRQAEHGTALTELASGLTRHQARALENEIIRRNQKVLANEIGSVAENHRFVSFVRQWAENELSRLGLTSIRIP